MGLGGPAIEEVGDLDSVDRMDPEGQRVQAAEEADDPASVGRMDPWGQGVPEGEVQAAEGPGSEAKAVEALEVAERNERHPAKVCP